MSDQNSKPEPEQKPTEQGAKESDIAKDEEGTLYAWRPNTQSDDQKEAEKN